MMIDIALRERGGPTLVSAQDWQRHSLESYLRPLANAGVISFQVLPSGVLIFPGHFVGRMRAPEIVLSVAPKSPQMVAAIEALAMGFLGKAVSVPGGDEARPTDIVRQQTFAEALRDCINEGVPWRYVRQRTPTSNPRGKIHFRSTLRQFLTAGVEHRLMTDADAKAGRTDFAAVVHGAYRCLGESGFQDEHSLTKAGRCLVLLPPDPLVGIDEAITIGERLRSGKELQPAAQRLISHSLEILGSRIRSAVVSVEVPGGTATFLDLERLWEMAVAQLYRRSEPGTVSLHGLRESPMLLLSDGGPSIDPDVIIRADHGATDKVVDAKYKLIRSPKAAPASDVYQIYAYVDALGAGSGSLVYLGDDTPSFVTALGRTRAGASVSIVIISPEHLLSRGDAALLDIVGQQTL